MIYANTASYDADSRHATVPAMAARVAGGESALREARAYSPLDSGYSVTPYLDSLAAIAVRPQLKTQLKSSWSVREEGGYYILDFLSDKENETDPELAEAADAETEGLRQAMACLDEAVNLSAVLRASMEEDADDRAMQAETALKIVHTVIDDHIAAARK